VPICLRIALLIVGASNTPRPGTKDMGGSSTVRLPVALIEIAWFAKDWEGIEQVFRLERTARILKTDQMRHEVIYGLSSLSMCQASPPRMLSLVRDHWAIEIVSSQMTKTHGFPFGRGGDRIADLHLLTGDHNTVNE
jgi:hypothetical protein